MLLLSRVVPALATRLAIHLLRPSLPRDALSVVTLAPLLVLTPSVSPDRV